MGNMMKIGDLCTYAPKSAIKAGEAIIDGAYMFFTSSSDKNKRYSEYQLDCEGIIMGTGGNATLHYYNGKFATSTDCVVLLPNESVRCKYLYYYLLHNVAVLDAGFKGAGLKHTNKNYINSIDIPIVPPLEEQDEVIAVLDSIQDILIVRTTEISKLDELIKARFVELFGDPILNNKNWDVVKIEDVISDVRYGTSTPSSENGKYPYLRMNNITFDGHLDLMDLKYIDISDSEIEKCIVRKGDVLFNRTNSLELVGKTTVFDLPTDMVIAGYIIRIRLNEKMLPEVLSQYMNLESIKALLRTMAKGAVNQANINAKELQSINIYLPPIELQKEFAEFVHQTDKSKVVVQKALDETQLLFDSLMQKYFG